MDAIHIICKLNEDDNFSIQQDSLAVNLTNKSHDKKEKENRFCILIIVITSKYYKLSKAFFH